MWFRYQSELSVAETQVHSLSLCCRCRQVDAWVVRLNETQRLAADADEKGAAKDSDMYSTVIFVYYIFQILQGIC